MMGIKVELNLDEPIKYPIIFRGTNRCLKCGAENSLVYIDIYGHKTREEVHPYSHLECEKCHEWFSIKWARDDNSVGYYPSAVKYSVKRQFANYFSDRLNQLD